MLWYINRNTSCLTPALQSAAKSKERRLQHAKDLEEKVEAQEAEVAEADEYVQKLIADNNTLRLYNQEASQLVRRVPPLLALPLPSLHLLTPRTVSAPCIVHACAQGRPHKHRPHA